MGSPKSVTLGPGVLLSGSISQAIPKELQGCNSFDPDRPFKSNASAFDSSQTAKNTTLPFRTRVKTSSPFKKNFKFLSSSLSPPKSLSHFCPKPLSLSHPPTTLVRRHNEHPSPVANGPTSSESSKPSGTLSFSLYPSLPHSFSHLTSPLSSHSSVVRRQNRAPSPVPKRPAHSVAADRHL
jgi:hypothetical protein